MAAVDFSPAIHKNIGLFKKNFRRTSRTQIQNYSILTFAKKAVINSANSMSMAGVAYFDADYYISTYPDVAETGCDPLRHFMNYGWREFRNPNAWLSTSAYLARHPELLGTGENPLAHMARLARSAAPWPWRSKTPDPNRSLLSTVIQRQPSFPIKWRNDRYLAKGLGDLERARSQLHTFVVLDALFSAETLKSLLLDGGVLWRSYVAPGPIEIRFALSNTTLNEGELSLTFTLFRQPLAILSFNIFPGDPLDRTDADRLFIGRMQAMPEGRTLAKVVSKALGDVTPLAALFAAAQGMAQALNLTEFIGAPASRHVSLQPAAVARCTGTYDLFYESVGAKLAADGLYRGPILGEERPMSQVKSGHKIRTRHKRALKQTVRDSARAAVEAYQRNGTGLPSPAQAQA